MKQLLFFETIYSYNTSQNWQSHIKFQLITMHCEGDKIWQHYIKGKYLVPNDILPMVVTNSTSIKKEIITDY